MRFPNQTKVQLHNVDFRWEEASPQEAALPVFPRDTGWKDELRSVVVYSLKDIRETLDKGRLKIKARFQTNKPNTRIQVRTRDVPLNIKDIFTGEIREDFPGFGAMGTAKARTVYFNDSSFSIFRGKYSKVPFTLENVRFHELGVGVFDINWQWEFRELDESETEKQGKDVWRPIWQPITITKHRLFVLLREPSFPWIPSLFPDFKEPPPYPNPVWVNALKIACHWARGSHSVEEIAREITQKLRDSGRFRYDTNLHYFDETWVNSGSFYASGTINERFFLGKFFLSKVLERLEGGHGLGEKANCLDFALMVTALSNILGCNLFVGKLQATAETDPGVGNLAEQNRFQLNPILATGFADTESSLKPLSDEEGAFFTYHAVAWQAKSGTEAPMPQDFDDPEVHIYDASLAFPADDSEEVSAAGMVFGGEGGYRQRLAANTEKGLPRCLAQPETVIKMQVV